MSLGQLIDDAFGHWRRHQRLFWLVVGPLAVLFTAIKIAVLTGAIKSASSISIAIAGAYIATLDYWLRMMLFNDWKQRAKALAANRATKRSTWASWRFIGFCAGYAIVVSIASGLVFFLYTPGIFSGKFDDTALIVSTLGQVAAMLAAALAFGSLLLFLPANTVGMPWNVGDGYRAAEGARGLLLGLAVCATLVSAVGPVALTLLGVVLSPTLLLVAGHVLAVVADFLALYVLAYGVSRVFVAKSGWTPSALAAAR